MLISPADLNQLIEQEVIDDITRGDENKATQAIKQSISAAKAYLSRYNLVALFVLDSPDIAYSCRTILFPHVILPYLHETPLNHCSL